MTPRWSYGESNASKWRPIFDELMRDEQSIEIPLDGNGKSLVSLKVRICDALKYLADGFDLRRDETLKPYADLKRRIRFVAGENHLKLNLRPRSPVFRPVSPNKIHPAQSKTSSAIGSIKLEPEIIKRLYDVTQDESKDVDFRRKTALILIRDLKERKDDAELIARGIESDVVLEKANRVLEIVIKSQRSPALASV